MPVVNTPGDVLLAGQIGQWQITGGDNTVTINNTPGIQVDDIDASSNDTFLGNDINNSVFNLGGGNDTASFDLILNSTVLGAAGNDVLSGRRSQSVTYNGGSNDDFMAAKIADGLTGQVNFFVGGSGADVFELPVYNRVAANQAKGAVIVTDFTDGLDLISMPREIYEAQGFTSADQYFTSRVRVRNGELDLGSRGFFRGAAFTIGSDTTFGGSILMLLKGVDASQISTADIVGRFSPVA